MKYLIVEDCKDLMLTAIEIYLKAQGYEVHTFRPNDEGLLPWNKNNQPGIVQLDGLEGDCFRLYALLKSDNPNGHFFICSGNTGLRAEAKSWVLDFVLKDTEFFDYAGRLPR